MKQILSIGATALAETAVNPILKEPFTWASLGTIAGCTVFALVVVQTLKAPLDRFFHIPTRLLVYGVCLTAMVLSTLFSGNASWEAILLAAVNALIPTASAYGAYELTFAQRDRAEKQSEEGKAHVTE